MFATGAVTVKGTPLLAWPATVTTTLPVVAPEGTGTMRLKLLQLVGVAGTPLKVTVLAPCVPPKVEPVIVTDAPTGPDVRLRLVIAGVIWKTTESPNPPTMTEITAGPADRFGGVRPPMLVSLQLVGASRTPPNVTVLLP